MVGATKGDDLGTQQTDSSLIGQLPVGLLQPFLRKVNVASLSDVWTNQWAAIPSESSSTSATVAYALGCVVDGDAAYVMGTIKDDTSMVQGVTVQPSQGGDDVWVAKLDEATGDVSWMTQLGSDGDERAAPRGSIVVTSQGDVLIFGDTTGSLYRQRALDGTDTVADIFVMSLDSATGALLDTDFFGGTSKGSENSGESETSPTDAPDGDGNEEDTPDGDGNEDIPTDEFADGPSAPTSPPVDDGNTPTYAPIPPQKEGHQYIPIGLQIAGPGYAGGLVYCDDTNSVFLAGATYVDDAGTTTASSHCFSGMVNLDNGNLEAKISRGSTSLPEACSAISFDHLRNTAFALGGIQAGSASQDQQFYCKSIRTALIRGIVNEGTLGEIFFYDSKMDSMEAGLGWKKFTIF